MTTPNISFTREFISDMAKLPSPVAPRVNRALDRMAEDPWTTELHPEKVKSAENGVYSSRADEAYRIIWKHIKPNDIVLCLVDKHDEAYNRATRKSFTLEDGVMKVADIMDTGAKTYAGSGGLFSFANQQSEQPGTLFIGYRNQELLAMGVPEDILPHVRKADNINQLAEIERLLPENVFYKLVNIAVGEVERPVVPDEKLLASLEENQGGDELHRCIDTDEFKRALSGSMEDWMLFLAPPQRYLIYRDFNGPSRLRGVAGSGKTVVALHRIRRLARNALAENQKVLFLTFGNRLPGVMQYLLNKLAGEGAPELQAIECLTIHQWCARFLRNCGAMQNVDTDAAQDVLQEAVAKLSVTQNNQSLLSKRSQDFFVDEIRYMIKGRDVQSLEEYLELDRSGRGTPLKTEERREMWNVYQSYKRSMRERKLFDYDDFIIESLRLAREGKCKQKYASAVVDEIQDLTEATMKLIRTIVPSGPNDLFLIGDGLQRIYPGGYSLNKLGIDIVGRSTLLHKNYRNTQQILQAAHSMIKDIKVDDLDDDDKEVDVPEYSVRQGEKPILRGFPIPQQEINWVAGEIQRLQQDKGYSDNDFAIIYRHRNPYADLIKSLQICQSVPVELSNDAESYFGPGVKRTTFHSVKGLEFKVIFVVGVTDGFFVPKDDWSLKDKALEDYLAREQRLLYVAMTRSRDLLYLTYSRGQPSRFLNHVPAQFIQR